MHVIWRKGVISPRINHYSISLLIIMGCENTIYGCNNYATVSVGILVNRNKTWQEAVEELNFLYT